MNKLIQKLTETPILWLTFVVTVVLTFSFSLVTDLWQLVLLDAIADPDEARAALQAMNEQQRIVHAWVTGTLDVAYPLSYGALFIGSAYKFFPKLGWLLALPSFLVIPVDLIEGVVQILALTDVVDWLSTKAVITTAKTVLFLAGIAVTIAGWLKWTGGKLFSR